MEEVTVRIDPKTATHIGLLFQIRKATPELWERCKEEVANKMIFPYVIEMPCGATQPFKYGWWLVRLPIEDIPCPCGNPRHWFVKFQEIE